MRENRKPSVTSIFCSATVLFLIVTSLPLRAETAPGPDHEDLVALFHEFRQFQKPSVTAGVPDYSAATMQEKYAQLKTYQERLAAIDPCSWSVEEKIDYHLVRAEMNGMEFYHRVVRPWARDPGFYLMTQEGAGPTGFSLEVEEMPMLGEDLGRFRKQLEAVPELYDQARTNLTDPAADFVTLALHFLGEEIEFYSWLAGRLAVHHPELVDDAEKAATAVRSYGSWLEANRHRMTAPAGVGKDNYNWLLKNVYLFLVGR